MRRIRKPNWENYNHEYMLFSYTEIIVRNLVTIQNTICLHFKFDLSMESSYEEELNQIRDTIDETFNKLCKLWDEIGCINDGKREERKSTIAASCKNHICQYLDRVYAVEDQVILFVFYK